MKASRFWPIAVAGVASLFCSPALNAQTITFPQAGQQVRGTVKVTFEGVPAGGYVMVYLDGTGLDKLREATSQPFYMLNTFALPEGQHTLNIVAFNAGGKKAGTNSVTFEVANSSVDSDAEGVILRVWNMRDRIEDTVRRYRIVAESNATIDNGMGGGGGGGAGGPGGGMGGPSGAGGGGDMGEQYIPAPLDWQLDILIRSVVRDVGMVDGAANIRSIVQEGYQRQRLSEAGGQGGAGGPGGMGAGGGQAPRRKKKKASLSGPTKAPWGEWGPAEATGRYFVKMVKLNGEEINATRKAITLAIGDLLPRFPVGTVHPGSTWETEMSIVGEIPVSVGVNVRAPMTFVSFEKIQTPAGVERRCAKLESRFSLPRETAEKIAKSIAKQVGSGAGGPAGGAGGPAGGIGGPAGGAGGGGAGMAEEEIEFKSVSTTVNREIWFDIEGNQVLKSTDTIDTNYEEEEMEMEGGGPGGGMGGLMGGMGGGEGGPGGAGGGQPKKVAYNLRITKYLDDNVPPPTQKYTNGAGTAHGRDSVNDIGIGKILAKP